MRLYDVVKFAQLSLDMDLTGCTIINQPSRWKRFFSRSLRYTINIDSILKSCNNDTLEKKLIDDIVEWLNVNVKGNYCVVIIPTEESTFKYNRIIFSSNIDVMAFKLRW